jgi:hypothetical protein
MNKLINDLGLNDKINQCIPIKEEQDEFKCETNKTDNKTIYKCNRDKYKNKIKEKYYDKLCKYESLLKEYKKMTDTSIKEKTFTYLKNLVKDMNRISENYFREIINEEKNEDKIENTIEDINKHILHNSDKIKNQDTFLIENIKFNIKIDQILSDLNDELNKVTNTYNVYVFLNIILIIILLLLIIFKIFK